MITYIIAVLTCITLNTAYVSANPDAIFELTKVLPTRIYNACMTCEIEKTDADGNEMLSTDAICADITDILGQTYQALAKLLPELIEECDPYTESFLAVCAYGNAAMIELFLDAGFEINIASDKGETGLHLAAYMGNTDTAACLLSHGASPQSRTKKNLSVMNYATTMPRLIARLPDDPEATLSSEQLKVASKYLIAMSRHAMTEDPGQDPYLIAQSIILNHLALEPVS